VQLPAPSHRLAVVNAELSPAQEAAAQTVDVP